MIRHFALHFRIERVQFIDPNFARFLRRSLALLGVTALVFLSLQGQAQDNKAKPITAQEARSQAVDAQRLQAGYQTSIPGWVLRPGDTLQLGRGSQDGNGFRFVREHIPVGGASLASLKPVSRSFAGRQMVLKELLSRGTAEAGYSLYGVIDPGDQPLCVIALDSAINKAELLPPVRYRPSAAASPAVPTRTARELIKLKAARDAGRMTPQEYERRRAKLLK